MYVVYPANYNADTATVAAQGDRSIHTACPSLHPSIRPSVAIILLLLDEIIFASRAVMLATCITFQILPT